MEKWHSSYQNLTDKMVHRFGFDSRSDIKLLGWCFTKKCAVHLKDFKLRVLSAGISWWTLKIP